MNVIDLNKFKLKSKRIILVSTLCALTAVFAVLCALTATLAAFEEAAFIFLQSRANTFFTTLARILTFAGFFPLLIGIDLVIEVIPPSRHKFGFMSAFAAGAGYTINHIFKVIFQRPRPSVNQMVNSTGLSFPSGHSAAAAAFFVVILIYVVVNVKDKSISIPSIILCVAMPIIVAISRVYLGVHYITDTVAGLVLGTIIALLVGLVLWLLLKRKLNKFVRVHSFLFGKQNSDK